METYTTDIWGQKWTPCLGCPHATPGACCSRRHRKYCELNAKSPEVWAPIIAQQPPEHRVKEPVVPPTVPTIGWEGMGSLSRQLIVSRFREDVSWTKDIPFRVYIYNKGEPIAAPGPNCVVIDRPNTGREGETWLHHFVSHYDRLPDLTFTAQGDPFDHSPDFLARLQYDYTSPTSLTRHYTNEHPPQWIKDLDRVEWHYGHEVRYGDATIEGNGDERGWLDPSIWPHVFDCPLPRPLYFGYGAMMACPRDAIRSRPKQFWAKLLEEMDSGDSGDSWTYPCPVNPWSFEAIFHACLLGPQVHPHKVRWAAAARTKVTLAEAKAMGLATSSSYRPRRGCGCSGAMQP
jgi:hypothetical protein